MSDMMRKDLLDRLQRFDEAVDLTFDDDRTFRLIIVGGSALILLDTITRATHDIDVLQVHPDLLHLLEMYDINTRVEAYINFFPFNFDDRLKPIPIEGKRVSFFTASLEDIVIAKLSSNRDTDALDIQREEIIKALDWDLLEHLATAEDEIKQNMLNKDRYADFKASYDRYVERFRP